MVVVVVFLQCVSSSNCTRWVKVNLTFSTHYEIDLKSQNVLKSDPKSTKQECYMEQMCFPAWADCRDWQTTIVTNMSACLFRQNNKSEFLFNKEHDTRCKEWKHVMNLGYNGYIMASHDSVFYLSIYSCTGKGYWSQTAMCQLTDLPTILYSLKCCILFTFRQIVLLSS